jgi:hypothetical protein
MSMGAPPGACTTASKIEARSPNRPKMEFSPWERRRLAGISANTSEDAANSRDLCIRIGQTLMQMPAGRRRSQEEKSFSCVIGCATAHEELLRK